MVIPSLLSTGLLLSGAGALAYSIKSIPGKILKRLERNLLYTATIYQDDILYEILEDWSYKNHKQKYKDVIATLRNGEYPQPVKQDSLPAIKYSQEDSFFIIKYHGKNIMVSKSKEKMDKAVSFRELFHRSYKLKGLRAKDYINDFLTEIKTEYFTQRDQNIVGVYATDNFGYWAKASDIQAKTWDSIIIDKKVKEELIKDIDSFSSAKEWYIKRGIPYKRNYMLDGPPGNGKSSIAQTIAAYVKRDIHILNLNSLDNDAALIKAFVTIPDNAVLVLEDIDRAFIKRDNLECKISFSSLLNTLDGALMRQGLITVITTNHLENLDPALIRAGRVDYRISLPNPTDSLIKDYIEMFYSFPSNWTVDFRYSKNYSMSKVQEICMENKNNWQEAVTQLVDVIKLPDIWNEEKVREVMIPHFESDGIYTGSF